MSNLIYWIWLTTRKGVGATLALRLLDVFVTPQRVYYGEDSDYEAIGVPPFARKSLGDKSLDEANEILGKCDQLGIQMMTLQDADYPERLRQIEDPPPLLYFKGRRIHFDEQVAIGIVGARQSTDYGVQMASRLGLEIARGGGVVVSGIAEGIDSAAVRGALKGGGTVVSVLAGGIDKIFPYESRFLYQDVAAVGMLLSEYPPGTPHHGTHFPVRNRIISGLSLGVVAVECKIQSGTMITVRRALDQNRDVFAVPGNVDAPMSRGPNDLIRNGARLVTCGENILEEYRSLYPARIPEIATLGTEVLKERIGDLEEKPSVERGGEKKKKSHLARQARRYNPRKNLFQLPSNEIGLPTMSWRFYGRWERRHGQGMTLWIAPKSLPAVYCRHSPCSKCEDRLKSTQGDDLPLWWSWNPCNLKYSKSKRDFIIYFWRFSNGENKFSHRRVPF